jgi:hypothetical protein
LVISEIGDWWEQQVVQETKARKGRRDKRALASHLLEFLDPLLGDFIN